MLFVVQFEDVYADQPERLPERAEHMAGHLAFLSGHGNQVVASGALRPSADGVPTGGIWIVNAESKADVEALCKDDPFWCLLISPVDLECLALRVRRLDVTLMLGIQSGDDRAS